MQGAGRVITMGCDLDSNACPAGLLQEVVDWGLPDPKDKSLEEVRAIRGGIRCRVEELIDSLE